MEQKDDVWMATEPNVAQATVANRHNPIHIVHDEIDDLDWNKFPIFGPRSEEEAIARIEQVEAEIDNPNKWIQIDDLHAELKRIHSWL